MKIFLHLPHGTIAGVLGKLHVNSLILKLEELLVVQVTLNCCTDISNVFTLEI